MKVVVYKEDEVPEQVLRLKLQSDPLDKDAVYLKVVNERGEFVYCGSILKIGSDGKINRISSVNADLGLDLDEFNRVTIR